MKKFFASVAAVALMGSAAAAQSVILVPQGEGPAGQQQFILVPIPQDQAASQQGSGQQGATGQQGTSGQQGATEQQARDRAEAMALDLYRRGYQRGLADAQSAAGTPLDPAAMEQIGRELFERGYMLGLMQAHARMTAQEMPKPGEQGGATDQQAGAEAGGATDGAEAQASATGATGQAAGTGEAAQQQVTPEELAQAAQGTAQQATGTQAATGTTPEAATQPGEMPQAIIRTEESEQYGEYLVDANGRPVYILEADRQGEGAQNFEPTCYDDCAEAWPPVLTQGTPPRALGDADEGMLSTTEREDGTMQVTYDGWPLYYYVEDVGAEQPAGQDVHDEWGEWYLLEPSGEAVGH